ncbi:MAG: hypothetical protein HXY34_04190 [Candidatus Thorarchaeota archaeon]|nr:hypothetical protein [Candidatus Thorarchaeota archaeon]
MVENNDSACREREVTFRELIDLPSTTHATFGLYRYPAKFIPQVIMYILKNYARPGMKVFDPFAGYGTVGVVSRVYGCDYEMWDLNPLIETLHRIAVLEPAPIDVDALVRAVESSEHEFIPDWSNYEYWFPEEFFRVLSRAWGYYHSLEDQYAKLVLTIPLLRVSRHFSLDDMGRMKLSKSPRSCERVARLAKEDWESRFSTMLRNGVSAVQRRLIEYNALSPKCVSSTVRGGVDTLTANLEGSADILITSPPYLQSQEYMRYAKMDLYWLGYSEGEVRRLSKLELPYRSVAPERIRSETFQKIRDGIREHHIRKLYDAYFSGVIGALTRLSKDITSRLFLFVGRSSMRGRQVPIDRIMAEHFVDLGWTHEVTLVDTIVARRLFSYHVNPATQRRDDRTSAENLVVLAKT